MLLLYVDIQSSIELLQFLFTFFQLICPIRWLHTNISPIKFTWEVVLMLSIVGILDIKLVLLPRRDN